MPAASLIIAPLVLPNGAYGKVARSRMVEEERADRCRRRHHASIREATPRVFRGIEQGENSPFFRVIRLAGVATGGANGGRAPLLWPNLQHTSMRAFGQSLSQHIG